MGTSGFPGHQPPRVDGETMTQSVRKWGVQSQGLDWRDSDTLSEFKFMAPHPGQPCSFWGPWRWV